ncbi:CHAD domain-containing protein [Streptomyces sp. NPDC096324]|uniref:CHAD domain-containing protein n=1 Tax=Streptomyces sp. NPDC096324 TaxID=3366085 RepID=UPI0038059568
MVSGKPGRPVRQVSSRVLYRPSEDTWEPAVGALLPMMRGEVVQVALQATVRRDAPDSVHQMRTAARGLRGCLRSHRSVLDREATDLVRRGPEHPWAPSSAFAVRST